MTGDTPLPLNHRHSTRALWAGIVSLLFPGLGHVYAGAWGIGISLIAIVTLVEAGLRISTQLLSPTVTAAAIVLCLGIASFSLQLAIAFDAGRRALHGAVAPNPQWHKRTWAVFALVLAITIPMRIAVPIGWGTYHIPSGSNIPTILRGDYVMVSKKSLAPSLLANKIVVFRPPGQRAEWLKRVVALPGDTVQIRAGILYVNSKPAVRSNESSFAKSDVNGTRIDAKQYRETMPDGYSHDILKYSDDKHFDIASQVDANNTEAFTVPAGDVFVLGDNRDDSIDSRFPNVGPIPVARIEGLASVIIWAKDRSRIGQKIY